MFINTDPTAEAEYRRERIASAFRSGSTRGTVLRRRRYLHLPRRSTEQRS
jgi:hypothetical protein